MDNIRNFWDRLPGTNLELRSLKDPLLLLRRTFTQGTPSTQSSRGGSRSTSEGVRAQQRARTDTKETKPLQFTIEGELLPGAETLFSVDGLDLVTTPDTWVFGELTIGAQAKVKGVIMRGHERVCTSIITSPPRY